MKILCVGHAYMVRMNRGKWRSMRTLFPGTEVRIVVPQRWPDALFTLDADPADDFPVSVLPTVWAGLEGRYFYRSGLARVIRDFRPDVIHVEQGADSLVLAQTIAACKWIGAPARIGYFTWWNLDTPRSLKVRLIEKFNFRNVDFGVCGNNDSAALMRSRGFKKQISLAPQLGVEEALFDTYPAVPKTRPVVGFIGRIVEGKGVEDLVEAWVQLHHRKIETDLLFIGKGEAEGTVKAAVQKSNLSERMRILGPFPHDKVIPYLRQMDVLVLPSRTSARWKEQFGHVLVEAMACGVPVIGTNSGAIPEVIGDAGIVVPEKSPAAISDALVSVLTNQAESRRLSALGKRRAQERFSDAALARGLHDIFQKALLS